MSRSISRMGSSAADALPEAEVPGKRRILSVKMPDGAMLHHERMLDAEGQELYDQSVTIDYVVGSGRRALAFLHRRGNLLFMSPLNWYTQAGRWDLAPGYAKDDSRRFDRRVTDECLGCHAGRVAAVGRMLNAYQEPAFQEMGIGCENCHGPGGRHVALHQAGTDAGTAADTIVNPAHLEPAERESVCNQCHLQAAARVLRHGRSDLDFRPGRNFEEVWTAFEQGSGVSEDGRTRSVSHVQQMRESRCFQRSDGRCGCISCHDPHRAPSEAERAAFYRQRCLRCHGDRSCTAASELRAERDDSCIACHMPARDSSNMSHVTQTDHRVIRDTRRPPAAAPSGDDDLLTFFDGADTRLDDWERDRALGLAAWKHLSKKGRKRPAELLRLLESAADRNPDDGAVLIARGSIAAEHGLTDVARRCFEQARMLPASEEAALSGLLDIYYLSSDRHRALECAERLIEIDPGDARTQTLRADLLAQTGRSSEGIEAARKALQFNPTLLPVRQWLSRALRDAGRVAEQQIEDEIIRCMQEAGQ